MKIPKNYKLWEYKEIHPLYDTSLPRIASELKKIDGHLDVIDIGANVGDTIFFIQEHINGNFLAVEGDEKYIPYLERNVSSMKGSSITIEKSFCGDEDNPSYSGHLVRTNGTTAISGDQKVGATSLKVQTLDSIIKAHRQFHKANLVKIDTDGYETYVFRGAVQFLRQAKPVLFFEFNPIRYVNDHSQDPLELFRILLDLGYKKSLFYDNFGTVYAVVDNTNLGDITEMIDRIDKTNIKYFDVLTYHESCEYKYKRIFNTEIYSSQLLLMKRNHVLKMERIRYGTEREEMVAYIERMHRKLLKEQHLLRLITTSKTWKVMEAGRKILRTFPHPVRSTQKTISNNKSKRFSQQIKK